MADQIRFATDQDETFTGAALITGVVLLCLLDWFLYWLCYEGLPTPLPWPKDLFVTSTVVADCVILLPFLRRH